MRWPRLLTLSHPRCHWWQRHLRWPMEATQATKATSPSSGHAVATVAEVTMAAAGVVVDTVTSAAALHLLLPGLAHPSLHRCHLCLQRDQVTTPTRGRGTAMTLCVRFSGRYRCTNLDYQFSPPPAAADSPPTLSAPHACPSTRASTVPAPLQLCPHPIWMPMLKSI